MAPQHRRCRVVASHALGDVDLSALRIFLNFSHHSTRDLWSLGELGDADLLLQPLGEAPPVLLNPVTIVWLGEMQAGTPPGTRYVLARPLQLDQVLTLLLSIERQEQVDAQAVAGVVVEAPAEPPPGLEDTAPLSPRPVARESALTFRLNRWPSAASLATHRYLPRLASLLTTRSLNVAELSRLSNVAEDECSAFLEDMASEGILDTQFPSELPSELASELPSERPQGDDAVGKAPAPPAKAPGKLRAFLRLN